MSKEKITFVSLVPGLTDVYPVYEAKKYETKWMNAARQDYKSAMTQQINPNHIMQCPGIFDLYNHGYIVPMWHDVMIKTEGPDVPFKWMAANVESLEIDGVTSPVGKHEEQITKYLPRRHYSIKGVVKFNTPWRIIAPKGVKFLMLPLSYGDTSNFDASIGMLDPGISNEVNVQVNWNVLNGETMMKIGTPLCHLIPISEKQFDMEVRDATDKDLAWEKKKNYFMNMSFFPKRNILKEAWLKHFRK